jgi:hypothetical protein
MAGTRCIGVAMDNIARPCSPPHPWDATLIRAGDQPRTRRVGGEI